jgi:hypothetical protein
MRLLAGLLALVAFSAHAQTTCPVAPADPVPRDQARITWTRPLSFTDGTAIAAATVLTYTVYRDGVANCTTNGVLAGQTALPVGTHVFTVTARVGTGPESVASNSFSKTIPAPPQVPNPPTNVTVASTRIDPDSWTCRDSDGNILSRHERQDKAQESCTNFALASVGASFEMRPSGYRIVAR